MPHPTTQTPPLMPVPPFTGQILQDTIEEHKALESTPFMRALIEHRLPRHGYVALMLVYQRLHTALDEALRSSTHPAVRLIWSEEMAKAHLLDRDVAFLCAGISDVDGLIPRRAAEATAAFRDAIQEGAASDPLVLIGYLFVTEGSTLGGSSLRKHLAATYGLEDDGLRFYSGYADPLAHWRAFKRTLDETIVEPRAQERVAAGAKEAFRRLLEIVTGLGDGLTAPADERAAAPGEGAMNPEVRP